MFPRLNAHDIVLAGGAGGLGRATAELLAGEGARVVVSYRRRAPPDIAGAIQADLTVEADRKRLVGFGHLRALRRQQKPTATV